MSATERLEIDDPDPMKVLADRERKLVQAAMQTVGLTQKSACAMIGCSTGQLSMALSRKAHDRGLHLSCWTKLLAEVRTAAEGPNGQPRPSWLRQSLARARADIDDVERTLTGSSKARLSPPGAVVLANDVGQIKLDGEDHLHQMVRDGIVFSVLLEGPRMSGRTSLLNRLCATARSALNRTYMINFGGTLRARSPLTLECLYEFFFRSIECPFERTSNELGWQFDFKKWATLEWVNGGHRPVSIFIEGLEHLASKESYDTVHRFLTWLDSLRDHVTEQAFSRLQIVSIFSPYESGVPDAYILSPLNTRAGHRRRLRYFSEDQCIELARKYTLRNPEQTGKIAFGQFSGQPYLTHVFVHSLHEAGAVHNNVAASPQDHQRFLGNELEIVRNLDGNYGRYWNAVSLFLDSLPCGQGSVILDTLARASDELLQGDWEKLAIAGVATMNRRNKWHVSEFVQLALSRRERK